jgi:integrase
VGLLSENLADDPGVELVTFGRAVIRVKRRGDGLWVARWREHGKGRNTTSRDKERLLKKARAKVKELAGAVGGRVLTHGDAELVGELKRVAGVRSPLVWLQEVEDAQKRLLGKVSLKQVVDYYAQAGMLKVERVPVRVARERFLRQYEKKWQTWSSYRKALQRFEEGVGMGEDLMVCDITREMLEPWLRGKGPSVATWNKLVGYWRTFLNWARAEKMLPVGEKHAAELLPVHKQGTRIPGILTPDQARKALEVLPAHVLPTFITGCWVGPRPEAELTKLLWSDFDFSTRYLHVRLEAAGKVPRERYVPLQGNVVAMLGPVAKLMAPGTKVSGRRHVEVISRTLREKGVIERWVPDVMRHSFISYMLALGHGAGQVAEWAGNSEKEIKAHYRKPLRREDGEAWFAVMRELEAERVAGAVAEALREGGRRGGSLKTRRRGEEA